MRRSTLLLVVLGLLSVPTIFVEAEEIHMAVQKGDIETVKKLLAGNPDLVNSKDKLEQRTPLHWAALKHHNNIVELLISKGADVNVKSVYKLTPLDSAVSWVGAKETIQLLEKHGGKSAVFTEMHIAVLIGDEERVKKLLTQKPDLLNAKDKHGRTPLQSLVTFAGAGDELSDRSIEQQKQMIENSGMTWEQIQTECARHKTMLKLLIAHGADVNMQGQSGYTALHFAANSSSIAKILLDNGATIDAVSMLGMTPLCFAISGTFSKPRKKAIEMLIASGADVNVQMKGQLTPLHVLSYGHWDLGDIAELLIKRGAEVNARDLNSKTPLHHAARKGMDSIVKALLTNGADISVVDKDGKTALALAVKSKKSKVVELLREHSIKKDSTDVP